MRRILIGAIAVVLALAPTAAAQITRADYVRTLSKFGAEPEVLETGSYFFGAERYRRDILREGERMSEIVLLETRERITMNHDMRAAQRGLLDWLWEIPSRIVRPQPSNRVPPADIEAMRTASGVDSQHERLGRRSIGGLVVSGSRSTLSYPDGRQRIIESWVVPVGRGTGATPWPVTLEQTFLTLDADGSEIGRERLELVSTSQIPDNDTLFAPSGQYEVQEIGPRRRGR